MTGARQSDETDQWPSTAAQAAHKAFHEAWGGIGEPLDLYVTSPIWESVAKSVLRDRGVDPAPAVVGEPFRHRDSVLRGRTCLRRADGAGWWPQRWEGGSVNTYGSSVCLAEHVYPPEQARP